MDYRPLDITVISADDLKNVNLISKMDVYVVVHIAGGDTTATAKTKRKTHVDRYGGSTPKWNHRLKFTIDGSSLLSNNHRLRLIFRLKSHRPLLGNKEIGEVSIPIRDLLHSTTSVAAAHGCDTIERVVDYQVRTPSGKPKGTLKFSYKFGDKLTAPVETTTLKIPVSDQPVTAYPPPPGVGYGQPPLQRGVGYAQPPYEHNQPPGYGYAPPTAYGRGYPPAEAYGYPASGYPAQQQSCQGYGYPPQLQVVQPSQQQHHKDKKKKKKGGSIFGLGLGAGLLGGLLVGDMISDVGEMAAHDAGFDDGLDF